MEKSSDEQSSVGPPYSRQRTVPRYTFIAVAEITEAAGQTCVLGKVAEISRKGCYVDTLNPLPVGTPLSIVISRDQANFVTPGKIIYAREGSGVGVGFLDPTDDQLRLLDSWLSELALSKRGS